MDKLGFYKRVLLHNRLISEELDCIEELDISNLTDYSELEWITKEQLLT